MQCSKCEFFRSKVYYLGFLIGVNGVQPLPENAAMIHALKPPRNINELGHFLGLVGFYTKFIPFFADMNACLNKMLRKGATFKWTKQCKKCVQITKIRTSKINSFTIPKP